MTGLGIQQELNLWRYKKMNINEMSISLADIGIDTTKLAQITGDNTPYFPLNNIENIIEAVKDVIFDDIEIDKDTQIIAYLNYNPEKHNTSDKVRIAFWIDFDSGNDIFFVEVSLDDKDRAYLLDAMASYIINSLIICDNEPIDIVEYEKVN